MSRLRKIVVAVFAIVLLGAGVLFLKDLRWKAAQRRRDPEYTKILSGYERNLRPGMSRAKVADYLHSNNVNYSLIGWGGDALAYAIKIGEDPVMSGIATTGRYTLGSNSILLQQKGL